MPIRPRPDADLPDKAKARHRRLLGRRSDPRMAVWTAVFHDLLLDLDQLGRLLHHAGFGKAAVSLAGQFLQGVMDGGPRPVRAVAVDSQLRRQFIGRLEADSPDVVGQLIRILLDLGDGFVAVGAVDADGPPRRNPMLGQEEHDLADLFLLLPALADSLESLLPDSFDVQQEVGANSRRCRAFARDGRRQSWPPVSGRCCGWHPRRDTSRCLRPRPDGSSLVHRP